MPVSATPTRAPWARDIKERHSPPARDVSPTVGLMPTTLLRSPGHTIEPSVSVPSAAAASPTATATPLPALEPCGSPRGTYAARACPPRAEKPFGMSSVRMCAHSQRFVFPRKRAPAARSRAATCASRGTTEPKSASEPAVVFIPAREEAVNDDR